MCQGTHVEVRKQLAGVGSSFYHVSPGAWTPCCPVWWQAPFPRSLSPILALLCFYFFPFLSLEIHPGCCKINSFGPLSFLMVSSISWQGCSALSKPTGLFLTTVNKVIDVCAQVLCEHTFPFLVHKTESMRTMTGFYDSAVYFSKPCPCPWTHAAVCLWSRVSPPSPAHVPGLTQQCISDLVSLHALLPMSLDSHSSVSLTSCLSTPLLWPLVSVLAMYSDRTIPIFSRSFFFVCFAFL